MGKSMFHKFAVSRLRAGRPAVILMALSVTLAGAMPAALGIRSIYGEQSERRAGARHYDAELFGKKYRLDDEGGLKSYIKVLDYQIERSKRDERLAERHDADP